MLETDVETEVDIAVAAVPAVGVTVTVDVDVGLVAVAAADGEGEVVGRVAAQGKLSGAISCSMEGKAWPDSDAAGMNLEETRGALGRTTERSPCPAFFVASRTRWSRLASLLSCEFGRGFKVLYVHEKVGLHDASAGRGGRTRYRGSGGCGCGGEKGG